MFTIQDYVFYRVFSYTNGKGWRNSHKISVRWSEGTMFVIGTNLLFLLHCFFHFTQSQIVYGLAAVGAIYMTYVIAGWKSCITVMATNMGLSEIF